MTGRPLVTIGFPVRNGAGATVGVVRSVLAQDHSDLELLISDNASTDDTEAICRALAREDERIVYVRRPENIGLVPNFMATIAEARGQYFRWIGASDHIEPSYVSRCLEPFAADAGLVLVSTQLDYELPDGAVESAVYQGTALGEPDPAVRFAELLRLLGAGYALLDPLYSMVRRTVVAALPFRRILRGDEVYAARMALAGRWAHVPEVLARRKWEYESPRAIAPRLGVSRWHALLTNEIQCRELLRAVDEAGLAPGQARRARLAVARLYANRYVHKAARAGRRVLRSR